jgi:hypothetical protein
MDELGNEDATWFQQPPAPPQRRLAHGVDDHVLDQVVPREITGQAVHDLVGASP